jgi:hypothetical protein
MPGWRPTSDNWEVVTAAIDPFLGSGSTLIAVDKTGRICRGVELDPLYVDVIVWRYESATDNRQYSRQTFEAMATQGRWNRRQSGISVFDF